MQYFHPLSYTRCNPHNGKKIIVLFFFFCLHHQNHFSLSEHTLYTGKFVVCLLRDLRHLTLCRVQKEKCNTVEAFHQPFVRLSIYNLYISVFSVGSRQRSFGLSLMVHCHSWGSGLQSLFSSLAWLSQWSTQVHVFCRVRSHAEETVEVTLNGPG